MKLFLKILAGIVIFITIVVIALNIYFTDERLKSMILPQVREAVGTEVQIADMSLTFFKSFPQIGIELNEFLFPEPDGDTLATLEQLVVGIELMPLLQDEISISKLILNRPVLNYHSYEDSSTNIDFLLTSEEDSTEQGGAYSINIPHFTIEDADINYSDETGNIYVEMNDLNAEIALKYGELIESTVNAELASLSIIKDSTNYIDNVSLSLKQTSILDLEKERLELKEGTFSIRGLTLNLNGAVSNWSSTATELDLEISSSSDNFGEIIRLAPPEYDEYLKELETKGSFTLEGSITGSYSEEVLPAFELLLKVQNGYIKNPDLPEAIQNINAQIKADQNQLNIENVEFTAVENNFSMNGTVSDPLNKLNRKVDLNADLDFDLATVKEFYPIDEDTLALSGQLNAQVNVRGKIDPENLEQLLQSSSITLRKGYIRHKKLAKPLEDITLTATASGSKLNIREASFETGENSLTLNGTVTNYLSENPFFNLEIDGDAVLSDISEYYSLEPWIQELSGKANLNLRAAGPAGNPQKIQLNGALKLTNVQASGDSLTLPVKDLNGTFSVTPRLAKVNDFTMKYGSSDIQLNGEMKNYLGMLEENPTASEQTVISGSYSSNILNLDEMIDWDAENEASAKPILIDLPDLNASVKAKIDRLIILGVDITQISGTAIMNPKQIRLDQANANLFDGTATGNFVWDIPRPDRSKINFRGSLSNLTAEAFFGETGFLGKNSNIHKYLNGALNAEVTYSTGLNERLEPVISTTKAQGSFGMTRARLSHHPIQEKIAALLKVEELTTLALDSWNSTFTIANEIMTFKNFNLTSENIGLELDGTLHLTTEKINFNATLSLPESFKSGISKVLPDRAADALQREDGTIAIPLKITGTMSNPQVREDDTVIKKLLKEYLKEKGGKLLDSIFGN